MTYAEIIERANEISANIARVMQENERKRGEFFCRTRQRAMEQINAVTHQETGTDED
jgi:hypothetical protein